MQHSQPREVPLRWRQHLFQGLTTAGWVSLPDLIPGRRRRWVRLCVLLGAATVGALEWHLAPMGNDLEPSQVRLPAEAPAQPPQDHAPPPSINDTTGIAVLASLVLASVITGPVLTTRGFGKLAPRLRRHGISRPFLLLGGLAGLAHFGMGLGYSWRVARLDARASRRLASQRPASQRLVSSATSSNTASSAR